MPFEFPILSTADGNTVISGIGDDLRIDDNIESEMTGGLWWIDSDATGDYVSTFRLTGEGSNDTYQGGYLQYDAFGNEFIIGSHNTADALTSSDIESIGIDRATGDVRIIQGLVSQASTTISDGALTISSTTATSTIFGSLYIGTSTPQQDGEGLTLGDDKRISFWSNDNWTYATGHLADRLRFYNVTSSAKSALTFYDATTTTPVAVAAIVAHDYLDAGETNEHKHISIEVVDDEYQDLNSVFECKYGYAYGDSEEGYCGTASGHNFRVGSGSDLQIVDGNIVMTSEAGVFDLFPADQSTIGLRIATTTAGTDTILLTVTGADFLRIDDDLHMQGTTPLLWQDAINASSTHRLTGESTLDYRGLYIEYGGVANRAVIGTHDSADTTVANDIPQIYFERAGGIEVVEQTIFTNGNVGIGTSTPSVELDVFNLTGTTTIRTRCIEVIDPVDGSAGRMYFASGAWVQEVVLCK